MLNDMTKCDDLVHTGIGTALPISRSTATEKPGPSAASGFGAGCGAAIRRDSSRSCVCLIEGQASCLEAYAVIGQYPRGDRASGVFHSETIPFLFPDDP
jgi:hypothetical protein